MKSVKNKNLGIMLVSATEILFPEHRPINMTETYVEFSGFIDEIHKSTLQTQTDSTITVGKFEYGGGNTRIHYTYIPQEKIDNTHDFITLKDFKSQLNELHDKPFKDIAKNILKLSPRDRKEGGKLLNELKKELESKSIDTVAIQGVTPPAWFDISLPGIPPTLGHTHLITQAINEIEEIFSRLGFVRRRYPEIESDWYYAEGLNIPKDHPARDDQETFYFSDNVVLTAHTSNGQLREMELLKKPPIKMINIGKTYRRQASNTHSPMFHQFEGLLIDKNITMSHLVGVSNYFVKNYFGPDREIRLRPHHFQFTEPSFEVDINCHLCKGTGIINGLKCKVCKSGWLELGGAGMVHPNVLKNGGIDPTKYGGFAFGWGVERVIFMKHQVTDNLRELYTQDLRFLQQG